MTETKEIRDTIPLLMEKYGAHNLAATWEFDQKHLQLPEDPSLTEIVQWLAKIALLCPGLVLLIPETIVFLVKAINDPDVWEDLP